MDTISQVGSSVFRIQFPLLDGNVCEFLLRRKKVNATIPIIASSQHPIPLSMSKILDQVKTIESRLMQLNESRESRNSVTVWLPCISFQVVNLAKEQQQQLSSPFQDYLSLSSLSPETIDNNQLPWTSSLLLKEKSTLLSQAVLDAALLKKTKTKKDFNSQQHLYKLRFNLNTQLLPENIVDRFLSTFDELIGEIFTQCNIVTVLLSVVTLILFLDEPAITRYFPDQQKSTFKWYLMQLVVDVSVRLYCVLVYLSSVSPEKREKDFEFLQAHFLLYHDTIEHQFQFDELKENYLRKWCSGDAQLLLKIEQLLRTIESSLDNYL